mgnify:CR=1 FL=1
MAGGGAGVADLRGSRLLSRPEAAGFALGPACGEPEADAAGWGELKARVTEQGQALGFARRYNPMALQTDSRIWRDTDFIPGTSTPSGIVLPTNGDNIAQENEIGPSGNNLFGRALTRRPDPNIQRAYNVEYSAIVQHQLMDRVGILQKIMDENVIKLRAAIEARRRVPGTPVLVLSQYVERQYATELLADIVALSSTTRRAAGGDPPR